MARDAAKTSRSLEFDLLRFLSAVAVVMIHTGALVWREIDVNSSDWLIITVWDMLSKFSVPVFFMVSGAFLLDSAHKSDIKTMLTKRIPKLLIAFIFWSGVYTFMNVIRSDDLKADIKWIIVEFFTGEYHMWYIWALCCLYVITPLLKVIADDEKLCKYFLALFAVFQLVLPFCEQLPKVGVFVTTLTEKSVFRFAMGYSGYYVLGYYLKNNLPKGKIKALIYSGSVIGTLYTIISVVSVSRENSRAIETTAEYLTWNVAITAIAVYTAVLSFCCKKEFGQKSRAFVINFATYSFGIYLVHPAVLLVFQWLGFSPILFNPIISVPIITVCTTAVSYVIVAILRKIPKIGKMIT